MTVQEEFEKMQEYAGLKRYHEAGYDGLHYVEIPEA